jgi:quercetin dioxygenase-like cupin family protein
MRHYLIDFLFPKRTIKFPFLQEPPMPAKTALKRKPKVQPTIGGSTYVKPDQIAWEPGASLPMHKHPEIEQTWVLEGSFYDHDGICKAGEYVWRTPGSIHETHSDTGAVILAIYRKPNMFYRSTGEVTSGYDT